MTDKKVTSACTTWHYKPIKGLSCDHLVGEGFLFFSPQGRQKVKSFVL